MNIFRLLLLAVLLYSCKESTGQNEQKKSSDSNWEIREKTAQTHFYNKLNLLDTTLKTEYFYLNGSIGDSINFIITRKYDIRNNLITERSLQVSREKELSLDEEKKLKYDSKNNLIEEIAKSETSISIIRRIYNNLNQEIKRVEIIKIPEALRGIAKDQNIEFDTTIFLSEYNSKGNLIKQVYQLPNDEIVGTTFTTFSNGFKLSSSFINLTGDTMTITSYEKHGDLLAEIRHKIKSPLIADTSWYDGKNKVKTVFIDAKMSMKYMYTYKYDDRGNEIENISYK